ncbi:carbohydrate kinase family protein [Pseudooceanicola sp. MF1-13]|uniref:carbohydrate kinase family protein n=1 Tax=Pseudooceanicola sp. MF1-13 TaxID=3379095 RepID=UPI0038917DB8
MPKSYSIAVGGENLIDQVTTDGHVVSHPGGSPFNVAVAIARQGADVRYVSPISTDQWGDLLAERLTDAGVNLTGGRNDRPTTMARVTVTAGIPSYMFERVGTAERAVDVPFLTDSIGMGVQAVHTGSLTLIDGDDADAWELTLAQAYDNGTFVSVDPNVRLSIIADPEDYRVRITRVLGKVHLLKLSDEDLSGLYPDLAQDDALAQLRAKTSALMVVLTRGPEGASAWLGDTRVDIAAPPVNPLVDTVGAGDTFMANMLVALGDRGLLSPQAMAGITPDAATQVLTRAAQAAALNCQRAGCNPPTRDELDAV